MSCCTGSWCSLNTGSSKLKKCFIRLEINIFWSWLFSNSTNTQKVYWLVYILHIYIRRYKCKLVLGLIWFVPNFYTYYMSCWRPKFLRMQLGVKVPQLVFSQLSLGFPWALLLHDNIILTSNLMSRQRQTNTPEHE